MMIGGMNESEFDEAGLSVADSIRVGMGETKELVCSKVVSHGVIGKSSMIGISCSCINDGNALSTIA